MSQTVYDLYNCEGERAEQVLSIEEFWIGESGTWYADVTLDVGAGVTMTYQSRVQDLHIDGAQVTA